MEKKNTSWGWTIFWLVFFWPVGLFLVIKKFATDKSALMSGKIGVLLAVGWILIVFGALGFIGLIGDPDGIGGVIIALLLVAGGILLLNKVSKTKKTASIYKKYIDVIVNQNIQSIDNVASAVGLSYEAVAKDLQDMINIGYLKDAYIHQGNREIILKQREPVPVVYAQTVGTEQAVSQAKVVRCSGCGANNTIMVGSVSECEYCGTPINV